MPENPTVHFTGADRFVRAALSGLSARQRAVANNVANIDTPNFKASEVRFEDALMAAVLGRGREARSTQTELNARVARSDLVDGTVVRADGNNVDIDREMVQLAETTLTFSALTQVMAARLGIVRSVITDGRR